MEFKNQEQLPTHAKETILTYANQLAEALEDNLKSIVVYGSVLGKYFIPGKSNINLILVLQQVDVAVLRKCLKLVEKSHRKNFVAPLIFTPQHITSSLDVFPIEFMEINDNHLTIYGNGYFDNLKIEKKHLRLQCEREIKGKIIHLRQGYLESTLRGNSLKLLLEDSLRSILPLMRATLRLQDCSPPVERSEVIHMLCEKFPLDKITFLMVLDLKGQKKGPIQEEMEILLSNYLIQLQKLAHLVDQMEVA